MRQGPETDAHRLSEQAYEQILTLIETGALRPGTLLEERGLAQRLGVSRTPVRTALSRLVGEGLADRLSNGLLAVTELGLADFAQLIQFRRMLETEAAFLACGRIPTDELKELVARVEQALTSSNRDPASHWRLDDDVHGLITRCCGNRWLGQSIATVRRKIRMCNVEKLPHRFDETCREHLAILRALQVENGSLARESMRLHIEEVRHAFVKLMTVR